MFNQVTLTQFERIDSKMMCYFVQMRLYGVAGLCRAMPAFGAARRFVGKKPHALEFVTWKLYVTVCNAPV